MPVDKNARESVELSRPTLIGGSWVDGDVEVYAFQRRHLIDGGYANGSVEDIASEAEKEVGALNALKHPEDRDDVDVWSVERAHEEGYSYGEPQEEEKDSHEESSHGRESVE